MIPARTPAQAVLNRGEDTSAQELVSGRAVGLGAFARLLARDRALDWVLAGGVASLIWFSLRLAAMRIFQVDECCNVFTARMVATGQAQTNLGAIDLFQLALAPLLRGASRSIDLFVSARFVMVEVFWLNLVLMVMAAGERLLSRRGLIALAGAATLAPLWDYGFEVRHDNLLLTGLLLMWCVVRGQARAPLCALPLLQSYFIAGALAVGLQFVAFKAFVYTIPISAAMLAFPPAGERAVRWKLVAAWASGVVGSYLLVRLVYGLTGFWEMHLATSRSLGAVSTNGIRFAPWETLGRLLGQTPLLLAMASAALLALAVDLRRRGKEAVSWEGNLPEGLLFLCAFAALMINPTPFPYNLLNLAPFAFLFAFRYGLVLWKEVADRPALLPAIVTVAVFAHFTPFAVATLRHLEWPNSRQEGLMRLAENLTDPVKDPVYDAIGMVPTRPIVDTRSFLHSFNIRSFHVTSGLKLRDMLAARPPAVLIPNYRTDGLPEADHQFIRGRYVALADDFWVLGKVLPAGGGAFEVVHAGRYRIASLEGSDLAGTYPGGWRGLVTPEVEGRVAGSLDGAPIAKQTVELAVGSHRIECATNCQPALVWVGPQLDRVHRTGPGDHRFLFVNWY